MSFSTRVDNAKPISLDILQLNIGLVCNKTCSHCHLEAGPSRNELMSRETMRKAISMADMLKPRLVDITGGAPEMNPDIRWLIGELVQRGHPTQLRTNLTVLLLDTSLIGFFAQKGVKLVASLPCYEAAEVDSVRGEGTFQASIRVIKMLNEAGIGVNPDQELDLVFNPEADFLPPLQGKLEEEYQKRLREYYGVEFTNLITIANMPVGRFRKDLEKDGRLDAYMDLLKETFNQETLEALMCRHQVNINWNGEVYDCDFNLALRQPMSLDHVNINDPLFNIDALFKRDIVYGEHCYGCTAGQGISCGGALTG
jgi:radical SAM/Cys-rich protein